MVCFEAVPMPDKPIWCVDLAAITRDLRASPDPWVDRATLEQLLGIGRRRAQQILAPCVGRQIGANGVADREAVIAHLERLARGECAHYEHQRRRRLAQHIGTLQSERRKAVLVEAPSAIINQKLENLPEGVSITPGRITVTFNTTQQALERLLALAMAAGNDPLLFERMATGAG
jgi:hypothetical protein